MAYLCFTSSSLVFGVIDLANESTSAFVYDRPHTF